MERFLHCSIGKPRCGRWHRKDAMKIYALMLLIGAIVTSAKLAKHDDKAPRSGLALRHKLARALRKT
jgi:hypothetical protein